MLELARRIILLVCLLLSTTLSCWTPGILDPRSSVPGWLIVAGVLLYACGRLLVREGVALDPHLTFLQTALGALMAAGFWAIALIRSEPGSRLWTEPDVGNFICILGALAGVIVLLCGASRAARRLTAAEDRVVVYGLALRREILPSQITGVTEDRPRRVRTYGIDGGESLVVPAGGRLAHRVAKLLPSPVPSLLPAPPAPRGVISWLFTRLIPALTLALALGTLVGFVRAGSAFIVGLQGLLAGMALGAMAGYWARWDHPHDYSWRRQLAAAVLCCVLFMAGQFAGICLALRTGTGWDWVAAMLSGRSHEEILGYSRYRWGLRDIRPGPVGWIFFNLLDLLFLFVFSWLLLGANLVRERPTRTEHTPTDSPSPAPR